jgi:hypothetical protein
MKGGGGAENDQRAPGTSRTEVETPYILEALSSIATTDDDHDVLHEISGMITARRSSDELLTSSVQTSLSACRPLPPPNTQILL